MLKKLLILCSFIAGFYNVKAQEAYRLSVESKAHYGFIGNHTPKIYPLTSQHFPIYEVTVNILPKGAKSWNNDYKKGFWGFSFLYTNFKHNRYLGNLYGAITHFNFPLSRKQNNQLYFRLGTGIGYVEKVFDRVNNNRNTALGSHLNMCMSGLFEYRFRLNSRLQLVTSVGITHFSNAAFTKPNLGINNFTAAGGLAYKLCKIQKAASDTSILHSKTKKYVSVINVALALNEATQPGGNKYIAYVASYAFSKILSRKIRLGAGTEYNYNSVYEYQFSQNHFAKVSRLGFFVQQETMIDRLSVCVNMGAYVYNKVIAKDQSVFQRLGLRYYLKNNLVITSSLKTHWGTAEFFDVGIGYSFN